MSGKVVIISTTLGVLAAGTGISLAATQGSSSDAVTCIVTVDAKAAVDANSALSDVFPVGTPLHLTSAGRQVDVTASAPLTAAAPTSAAPTTAPATTAPATTAPATTAPTSAAPSDPATADPTATTSAPAGGTPSTPAKKHHRKHHKPTSKATATPTTSAAATESNAEKAAQVGKVSIKAAANKGVDPNTVCVELSKNAFNVLGNVANGNNVGAFIATMTPTAAAPAGGAQATTSAPAAASSSAAAGTTTAGKTTTKKKHQH